MTVVCPSCGRADEIERVAAMVTGGSIPESEGSTLARVRLQNALQPPQQPELARSRFGYGLIFSLMLLAVAALLIIWGTFEHTPLTTGRAWTGAEIRDTVAGLAILVVLVGLFGFVLWRKERSDNARSRAYQQAMVSWQKAMLTWEQMYYCHRDHGVFVPHSRFGLVPPESAERLLAQPGSSPAMPASSRL